MVAGYANNGFDNDFAIIRYLSDGSLDSTFDSDGIVLSDFATGNDDVRSIALQTDDKIVAAGSSALGGFTIARYNTNGSLDTTFDYDGIVSKIGSVNYSIALQPDGKIVAAGVFRITRLHTNGSFDSDFASDGHVIAEYNLANSVAIQADGKIVAAGQTNSLYPDFVVNRFNPDGSLDSTFDKDGVISTDIGWADRAYAVAIQFDGKIIVAGEVDYPSDHPLVLARYIGESTSIIENTPLTSKEVTLYPNPARNEIQFLSIEEIENINIYSMDGKIVMQISEPSGYTISIKHLQSGKYYISFKSSNDTYYESFIKQ